MWRFAGCGRRSPCRGVFQPERVTRATLDVHLAGSGKDQQAAVQQHLRDAVAAVPGVTGAAYKHTLPLDLNRSTEKMLRCSNDRLQSVPSHLSATCYEVSTAYFGRDRNKAAGGTRVVRLRRHRQPSVAIVNRVLAKRVFNPEDVVGRRIPTGPGQETEIVGLVENGKYQTRTEAPEPVLFWPILQRPDSDATLPLKSQRDPQAIVAAVRCAVAQVDSGIPVFSVLSALRADPAALLRDQ